VGEAGGGRDGGGDSIALAEMAGGGGKVETESGGGGCAGGGDGDRAGGVSGEAVHAVLERSREGVGLRGKRREVEGVRGPPSPRGSGNMEGLKWNV